MNNDAWELYETIVYFLMGVVIIGTLLTAWWNLK